MQNYKKIVVKFEELSLEVWVSPEHEWLMETALVAQGYEVSEEVIRNHKSRHADELIEGKHFIIENEKNPISSELVENNNLLFSTNLQIKRIFWTKRGVIRLGFFIKSKRGKLFRDWAEDLIINKLENSEATPPEWFKDFQFKMVQELDNIKAQLARLEKRTALLPENLEAFVYIIHNPDSDTYKIGHTQDVTKRAINGRTFLPNLKIVMSIPCPELRYSTVLENLLHIHFYSKRVSMEWYRLDADDLIQIHELVRILGLI